MPKISPRLTDKFCKSAKPGTDREAVYPDGGSGLSLRVSPQGRRSWSFRYRNRAGLSRKMALRLLDHDGNPLGPALFPAVSLAEARSLALALTAAIDRGDDPALDRRQPGDELTDQRPMTFGDLFAEHMKACRLGTYRPRKKVQRARTLSDYEGAYERHIRAKLADRPLTEISRTEVRTLLEDMASRGIGAQTVKVHQTIRATWAFGTARDLTDRNPALGIEPPAEVGVRHRVLSAADLKAFWAAISNPASERMPSGEALQLGAPMAILLKLAVLLAQRRGELAGMRLSELETEGVWLIPSERMKANKAHEVPLPRHAAELIQEAVELRAGVGGDCVFPGARNPERPTVPGSITQAMGRVIRATGIPHASVHDLRRTAASTMASDRLQIAPLVISRVLAHNNDAGGGAAVTMRNYIHHAFKAEKLAALQAWEDYVLSIAAAPTTGTGGGADRSPRLKEAR